MNSYTSGAQQYATVSGASSGGFAIVWESANQDGSSLGAFGRRYDAAGQLMENEFQVNGTTANDQRSPSVGLDGTGRLVAVWQSRDQDGSLEGIYGRVFTAAVCEPLIITGQPESQTVCEGAAMSLAVSASGAGPFRYRWRKDGVDLADGGAVSGAMTASLSIDTVTSADAGSYDCAISDSCTPPMTQISTAAIITLLSSLDPTCRIVLLAPADGTLFTGKVPPPSFSWTPGGQNVFQVQFSNASDPFTPLVVGKKSLVEGTSFTPARKRWKKIRKLGASGQPVYWRVMGKRSGSEALVASDQVFSFVLQPAPAR